MKKNLSRRTFIKQATVASAAPLILPNLSFAAPANAKLQHAGIGVASQGGYDLDQIASHENVEVAALCDIDERSLKEAAEYYPNARLYRDWREMLDKEEGNIDSVNVSTPDHTHAPAAFTAIKKGIHVYCEKPLTHEVFEARKLTEAARKYGVVTQMGTQIHAHKFYRTAVHWAREGAIGKVKEFHSWCGARFTTDDKKLPPGSDPVPPHVDWDLWLGTGPVIPFKEKEYHPFEWRRFRDYGCGAVGDFACHIFDPVFGALGIAHPSNITAHAESYSDLVHPGWTIANYLFPGTDITAYDTIVGSWRDGGLKPDAKLSPHLPDDYELPNTGSILIGEDGTLVIPHISMPELHPLKDFENYPIPELEDRSHYHEFADVALGNEHTTGSNFDFAGPMSEAALLANVANQLPGQALQWDARRCKFGNNPEANKLLRRKYRKGFEVRGL